MFVSPAASSSVAPHRKQCRTRGSRLGCKEQLSRDEDAKWRSFIQVSGAIQSFAIGPSLRKTVNQERYENTRRKTYDAQPARDQNGLDTWPRR
jgi:hypothetical protein